MLKYILTFVGGLAIGGAAGYLIGDKIMKDKCDKYIDDEIAKILDDVRSREDNVIRSEDLARLNDNKKSSIDISKESNENKEIVKDYDTKTVEDDLPFEVPVSNEKHNIFDDFKDEEPDEEPDDDSDIEDTYPDRTLPPSFITKDEYDNDFTSEEDTWEKIELIFFTDNVIAEYKRMGEYVLLDSGECMNILGQDIFTKIVAHNYLDSTDHNRAFIRNNRLRIDFVITKSSRSYKEASRDFEGED